MPTKIRKKLLPFATKLYNGSLKMQKSLEKTTNLTYVAWLVFIICAVISPLSCKTQSTAPELLDSSNDNSIFISCNPASGGTGTNIDINISVMGNINDIKSFGLEMSFDPAVFQYVSTNKSTLTATWASVDGNETKKGQLIIGGFMGSGDAIPAGSSGDLAIIKIKVIYSGNDDGFSRQISIKSFIDDIKGMKPEPSTTTFTFRK